MAVVLLFSLSQLEVAAMVKERPQLSELRALQVLQDFSAAQLNQLSRNMTVLNVRKGEVIYRPGKRQRIFIWYWVGKSAYLCWEAKGVLFAWPCWLKVSFLASPRLFPVGVALATPARFAIPVSVRFRRGS